MLLFFFFCEVFWGVLARDVSDFSVGCLGVFLDGVFRLFRLAA